MLGAEGIVLGAECRLVLTGPRQRQDAHHVVLSDVGSRGEREEERASGCLLSRCCLLCAARGQVALLSSATCWSRRHFFPATPAISALSWDLLAPPSL